MVGTFLMFLCANFMSIYLVEFSLPFS